MELIYPFFSLALIFTDVIMSQSTYKIKRKKKYQSVVITWRNKTRSQLFIKLQAHYLSLLEFNKLMSNFILMFICNWFSSKNHHFVLVPIFHLAWGSILKMAVSVQLTSDSLTLWIINHDLWFCNHLSNAFKKITYHFVQ